MNIDYNLFFLFISNIIALFVAIWKLSQWEERLQQQINLNKKDINQGLESLRHEMKKRDHYISIQLNTLVNYIEKTTNYNPPSMDDFDIK
ncbi:hypothetical protein [Planktothrix sp. FACHB-1365]|uniref:hypothetical protein n=1 Tax=Planktothrix sp. FACHB-1365 TaxID=2692855 RepID=UPI001681FAF8|nr:hypothetical protein [Planktothrix sp. FACHB-1365]MBD2481548.1 hypothetical protein [Planktothrix sp. FACHB-1365]